MKFVRWILFWNNGLDDLKLAAERARQFIEEEE
jgi:hypothetical protein